MPTRETERTMNMDNSSTAKLVSRIFGARTNGLCPECGAAMSESERVLENGAVFVWYNCNRDNCSGQWLQKTPQQAMSCKAGGPATLT